jgi:hypothetical protein
MDSAYDPSDGSSLTDTVWETHPTRFWTMMKTLKICWERFNSLFNRGRNDSTMPLIRCTQKLLKELKVEPCDQETMPSQLGDWHANLLRLERRKCVLFTQDQTLYSLFVPNLKQHDFEQLEEVFRQQLFRYLVNEGLEQSQLEQLLTEYQTIKFAKTASRSVLGSMNDIAFRLKYQIGASGGLSHLDLDTLTKELNRVPLSAIDYRYGIEALKHQLEQPHL